jgi:hypothetical protein
MEDGFRENKWNLHQILIRWTKQFLPLAAAAVIKKHGFTGSIYRLEHD